jgi:hypothetical protein
MQTFDFLREESGEVYVKSHEAFLTIYPSLAPDFPLDQISEEIKQRVIRAARDVYGRNPSLGSLNNCKGSWNELSYLYSAHQSILDYREDLYIVKIGNESSIKFWQIYEPSTRSSFMNFLDILKEEHNLILRCSNPDFVVIKRKLIESEIPSSDNIEGRDFFKALNNLYKKLVDKCRSDDVVSFISFKTSNRPDRRYQILYEANITKLASKYIHSESNPLQFHTIGNSNVSDSEVFRSPLLSSLPEIEGPIIDSDSKITTIDELNKF